MKPTRAFWRRAVYVTVGLLLLGWLLNTPGGLLGKADAVAYAVCHRIDLRSFHLGERQLPLCRALHGDVPGRCVGIGLPADPQPAQGGTPGRPVIAVLALLVLFFVVDGFNSFISFFPGAPLLYQPQNWLRLLAGSGMGIAIAVALFPAFNQTVWVDWDPRPAVPGLRSLGGMALLMLLVDLIVLSENPLLLYPLALISAAGVLLLLTLAYTMVWVMVFRTENRYTSARQLVLPLVCGFGVALLQIILLDVARYALTGTWDGFHLG